jgi:hypothetical protein
LHFGRRRWAQLFLSRPVGLGQGYLSDIEWGRSQGSPEAHESIARALDVPKEWLR